MVDKNKVGAASEMKVALDLSADGFVSKPVSKPPYDLIFDDSGDLYRVQVKTASKTGQQNEGHSAFIAHGATNRPYDADDFDILAVCQNDGYGVAYWPWTEGTMRQSLTVWFDREPSDFRACNMAMANIASEMTLDEAIEELK